MTDNSINTITNLEKEWMASWIRKDIDRCRQILSDDFVLTSARGNLMSKEEWLAGAAGPFVGEELNWLDIKVRIYGDTAVVNARTSQKASVNGQDWSGVFLLTDVWVNQNGNWQVVARHSTGPLKE